jgi:hypothetical protein
MSSSSHQPSLASTPNLFSPGRLHSQEAHASRQVLQLHPMSLMTPHPPPVSSAMPAAMQWRASFFRVAKHRVKL